MRLGFFVVSSLAILGCSPDPQAAPVDAGSNDAVPIVTVKQEPRPQERPSLKCSRDLLKRSLSSAGYDLQRHPEFDVKAYEAWKVNDPFVSLLLVGAARLTIDELVVSVGTLEVSREDGPAFEAVATALATACGVEVREVTEAMKHSIVNAIRQSNALDPVLRPTLFTGFTVNQCRVTTIYVAFPDMAPYVMFTVEGVDPPVRR